MAAVDLPEGIASDLLRAGVAAHQQAMTDITTNASHVHNLTRLSAYRRFDELGTLEARAHGSVLATPSASPATQQPT